MIWGYHYFRKHPYGWWFRNPVNSPVEVGSLYKSHYLQGFSTIPDGDRRMSSTSILPFTLRFLAYGKLEKGSFILYVLDPSRNHWSGKVVSTGLVLSSFFDVAFFLKRLPSWEEWYLRLIFYRGLLEGQTSSQNHGHKKRTSIWTGRFCTKPCYISAKALTKKVWTT